MTDIEKAIEFAEKNKELTEKMYAVKKLLSVEHSFGNAVPTWETIIQALQEKLERENGCGICKNNKYIINWQVIGRCYKYCPLCGRKL